MFKSNSSLLSEQILKEIRDEYPFVNLANFSFEGRELKDSSINSISDEIFTVYYVVAIKHIKDDIVAEVEASLNAEYLYKYNRIVYSTEVCNIAILESKLPKSEYWLA